MNSDCFCLHSRLDVRAAARRYQEHGRVHVSSLLEEASAQQLAAHLAQRSDWRLIFNHGDQLYEFDEVMRRDIGAVKQGELTQAAHNSGHSQFQYLYENLRVPDEAAARRERADLLTSFAEFLNSEAVLELVRAITDRHDIVFADCQATCYRQGHFLTTHDDDVAGKSRVAAYVFGLTRGWRAEWGGQLQFLGSDGHVAEAFVPRFNGFNLLRVPQPHLVSVVSPLAGAHAARYSITGWFRSSLPA
jgi:Rps23 Pro-64 3,4-dihydroxylase Tpa1-like proline 4-hydroxylase